MNNTSLSLLNRLRHLPESEDWDRLQYLYAPLLRAWLGKYEVRNADADDLMQEVLLAVSKDLRTFEHSGRPGAFRAWLKGILLNRLRNFWRTRDRQPKLSDGAAIDDRLSELQNPASELSRLWNAEHDRYVLRQLLEMVKPQFEARTWEAFCRVSLDGEKPRDVAGELEISVNSVFLAKSRVLRRLRQEADGLVESSGQF